MPWNLDERRRFWEDISRAKMRPLSDYPIKAYLRERGLRILVQTRELRSESEVRQLVDEAIRHPNFNDIEVHVSRLFDEDVPEDLRLFFEVVIEGVDPEDLEESPYDACYSIRSLGPFVSAEPDIAYQDFLEPLSLTFGTPVNPVAATDKAWALRKMKADAAWHLTLPAGGKPNGQGSLIAHLDTGYVVHDDLDQGNFVHALKRDFITRGGNASDPLKGLPYLTNPGHGTKTGSVMMSKGGVAPAPFPSTSSGTTGPGEITGVAREASYVPIRCIKSVVVIFAGDVAKGVQHATTSGCHVVSMSLGGFGATALRKAIELAVSNHIIVVAAAGNIFPAVVYPARYPECIAMAASNVHNVPWTSSASGTAVALTAPGEDVWTAEPTRAPNGTGTGSGTSYATAHMAGVAALWMSFFGRRFLVDLATHQGVILQVLLREHARATAYSPPGWDTRNYGSGIVDVYKLLSNPPPGAAPLVAGSGTTPLLSLVDWPYVVAQIAGPEEVTWRLLAQDLGPYEHELSTLELRLKSVAPNKPPVKVSHALKALLFHE
jgi:subtilisin family serine protease